MYYTKRQYKVHPAEIQTVSLHQLVLTLSFACIFTCMNMQER